MNTVLTAIGGTIASLLPGDKQNGLAHERTVLSVIGRTVTDPFSRTGVFDRLIDLVSELIKSDRIAITVLDPDRGALLDSSISAVSKSGTWSQVRASP